MEQINSNFKGVWLPKNILSSKDLTLREQVFLMAIKGLDNENHCFASNRYFADIFCLKITRVSQVINSLIKKEFIYAKYIRKDNLVVKRVLTLNDNKFLH